MDGKELNDDQEEEEETAPMEFVINRLMFW